MRQNAAEMTRQLEAEKKKTEHYKYKATKYKTDLLEIDKQLIEAAEADGISLFGIGKEKKPESEEDLA